MTTESELQMILTESYTQRRKVNTLLEHGQESVQLEQQVNKLEKLVKNKALGKQ